MKMRFLAAFLAMVLLLTACGNKSAQNGATTAATGDTTAQTDPTATDPTEPEGPSVNVQGPNFSADIKLIQKGTIEKDDFSNYSGDFLSKYEDDRVMLLNLDGENKLGKSYAAVDSLVGNGIVVVLDEPANGIRQLGVVDVYNGKELVPCGAVDALKLNDRFLMICYLTETTTDKDNAFGYYFDTDTHEQVYYKGYAQVLDLEKGQMVPNLKVTTSTHDLAAAGETIFVDQDFKTSIAYDPDGKELGTFEYMNPEPDSGFVLQGLSDTTPVFDGKMNNVGLLEGDIFNYRTIDGVSDMLIQIMYVETEDGKSEAMYQLIDLKGREKSVAFEYIYGVADGLVINSKSNEDDSANLLGVADMEGNVIIPYEYRSIEYVDMGSGLFSAKNALGEYILFTKDGKQINVEPMDDRREDLVYTGDSGKKLLVLSTGELIGMEGYASALIESLVEVDGKIYDTISGKIMFNNVADAFGCGDSVFVRLKNETHYTRYVVQYS